MFRLAHRLIYGTLLVLSCISFAAGQTQPCQQGTLADVLGTSCSVGSLILNFRTPFTGVASTDQQQGTAITTPISASAIGFMPVQINGQVGYKLVLNFVLGPGTDSTFVGDQLVQFGYTPQAVDGSEIRAVQLQIDATAQAPPQGTAIVQVLDFQNYNTGFLATDAFFAIDPSFTFPPEHLTDHFFLEVPATLSTGGASFDPLTTQVSNFVVGTGSVTLTSATFLFQMEPIVPAPPQAALTYTNIDIPGTSSTVASNINNSGQIAGNYVDSLGVSHGFVTEQHGGYTAIDFPGAVSTAAGGINDQGNIVGSYTDVAGNTHGFLSTHGNLSTLDPPGSIFSVAIEINDRNQVVGEYELDDGNLHGYLFENGQFTTIDQPASADFIFTQAVGINNRGEVTGDFFDPNMFRGFSGRNGSFKTFDVPSQADAFPASINDKGDFVGSYNDTNLVSHGFLNQQGSFQTVDYPGAATTFGSGINNSGTIVGIYENSDGVFHAFLAEPGKGDGQAAQPRTTTIPRATDKPVCGSAEWRKLAQSGLHGLGCKPRH